jgi:hypothetical protein
MGFLDFIKNRQSQTQSNDQPSQQQETAKEMYTRQAGEERINAKPVDQGMTPEQRGMMAEAQAKMQSATQQMGENTAPSPAQSDGATNPQPMRQNSMSQDKVASELSPTSAQMGTPAIEKDAPRQTDEAGSKTQETAQQRSQSMGRTTPSWER